jgi:hypothetical protein
MKAHELAKKLLALPDYEVMVRDSLGPNECDTPYEYVITDEDAEMCGCCEDIVGYTVIALSI